jgi:hypothetical protein
MDDARSGGLGGGLFEGQGLRFAANPDGEDQLDNWSWVSQLLVLYPHAIFYLLSLKLLALLRFPASQLEDLTLLTFSRWEGEQVGAFNANLN